MVFCTEKCQKRKIPILSDGDKFLRLLELLQILDDAANGVKLRCVLIVARLHKPKGSFLVGGLAAAEHKHAQAQQEKNRDFCQSFHGVHLVSGCCKQNRAVACKVGSVIAHQHRVDVILLYIFKNAQTVIAKIHNVDI